MTTYHERGVTPAQGQHIRRGCSTPDTMLGMVKRITVSTHVCLKVFKTAAMLIAYCYNIALLCPMYYLCSCKQYSANCKSYWSHTSGHILATFSTSRIAHVASHTKQAWQKACQMKFELYLTAAKRTTCRVYFSLTHWSRNCSAESSTWVHSLPKSTQTNCALTDTRTLRKHVVFIPWSWDKYEAEPICSVTYQQKQDLTIYNTQDPQA